MVSSWFQQPAASFHTAHFWYPPWYTWLGAHGVIWWRNAKSLGHALSSHTTKPLTVLLSLSEIPLPRRFPLALLLSKQALLPPGKLLGHLDQARERVLSQLASTVFYAALHIAGVRSNWVVNYHLGLEPFSESAVPTDACIHPHHIIWLVLDCSSGVWVTEVLPEHRNCC